MTFLTVFGRLLSAALRQLLAEVGDSLAAEGVLIQDQGVQPGSFPQLCIAAEMQW